MTSPDDELQVHAKRLREHRGMDAAQLRRQYDDMGAVNYPDDAVVVLLAEVAAAEQRGAEKAQIAIWAIAREYLPAAIGFNTLPEIMRGIARQRDAQREIKDHLADTARKLTERVEAAEVALAAEYQRGRRDALIGAHRELREQALNDWGDPSYRHAIEWAAEHLGAQAREAISTGGSTQTIWDEVAAERARAHAKHGDRSMESADPSDPTGHRYRILCEEIGEVAKEFNDAANDERSVDLDALRKELIQVSAMAGAWADAIPVHAGEVDQ
jgi:hypothetical protein